MSQILVSFICLIAAWKMWEHYTTKQSCVYCGTFRGHKQDCPTTSISFRRPVSNRVRPGSTGNQAGALAVIAEMR